MIECAVNDEKKIAIDESAGEYDSKCQNVEILNEELEALSYSISHDLRAPLSAIRNNGKWLCTQYAAHLDAEGRTMLTQIITCSEHIENLLDKLIAFSKVVRVDPQHSFLDMTTLAREVINELLEYEREPSTLTISLKPLPPAYGDTTLIRQVWYNLLSNAFKFTQYRHKREIEVGSYQFSGDAVYCVSDNGVGFDMQYVSRLFGAFQRLHGIEDFEGTGVGLAIVQQIIRKHGGRVWAEGKEDSGARFYFTLPKV